MRDLTDKELAQLGGWHGRSSIGERQFGYVPPMATSRVRERLTQPLAAPSGPPPGEKLVPRIFTGIDYGSGLHVKLALGAAGGLGVFRVTKTF